MCMNCISSWLYSFIIYSIKMKLHAKSGGLGAWGKSERKRMLYRGGKEKGFNNEFLSMEQ